MTKLVAIVLLLTCVVVRADPGWPAFLEEAPPPPDPRDDGGERYLELGPIVTPGWAGLRAQLDLVGVGGFSLGAAGSLVGNGWTGSNPGVHASGVGYLAYTAPITHYLQVRGQLGYGAAYDVDWNASARMIETSTPELWEGALFAIVRGNHDWQARGGPIVQHTDAGATTAMVYLGLARRW